jgi:hypothetical protein
MDCSIGSLRLPVMFLLAFLAFRWPFVAFRWPFVASMFSLSLKKLVTCGVFRSFNFHPHKDTSPVWLLTHFKIPKKLMLPKQVAFDSEQFFLLS